MNEVEKMLYEKKLEMDKIQAPEELEMRLVNALKNKSIQKREKRPWRLKAVAAIIAVLLIGYNFDTLAFYTKKLVGYDGVMNGTLKQLNELGKGQMIGKNYTFKNGVVVTLDGIMMDDNRLLAFYTVKDTSGKRNIIDIDLNIDRIKGLGSYHMNSSVGNMNEEKTEINYVSEFESAKFFEKNLCLELTLTEDDEREEGEITFVLDRSKAMGHTLKKTINQSVKVDESKIGFKSILASPTSTSLKGDVQNSIEFITSKIKGERFSPNNLDINLIANGKEVFRQGSSVSTGLKGITFQFDYDTLPSNLEKLQIELVSFTADHEVNQKVQLNKDSYTKSISVLEQNIEIKNIYESNGDTYITITTEETTILTKVYLIMDGKTTELKETISDDYIKMKDGTIKHTRTLHFPGTGGEMELDIQRMTYKKIYNEVIDIAID